LFFVLLILTITSINALNKGEIIKESNNAFISLNPAMQLPIDIGIENGTILKSTSSPVSITNTNYANMALIEDKNDEIIYYTVKQNDTLWDIAQKYNITVETILMANELSSSAKIQPNQKLAILPTAGLLHVVEKGDTLSSIAKRYQANMDEIMEFNEIKETDIYIGDIILVPNGIMPKKPVIISSANPTYTQVSSSFFISPTKGLITNGLHYYNAIDIANKQGTPILAAATGTVQQIKNAWPYGKYVTILHANGITTRYAHLSSWTVYKGQKVAQGEVIGYMGNTGRCISLGGDGTHLHFEVRGAKNPLSIYRVGARVSY